MTSSAARPTSTSWPSCLLTTPDLSTARRLADSVRESVGGKSGRGPLSMNRVCGLGSFAVVPTDKLTKRDAFLLPRPDDGFDVVIQEGLTTGRATLRRRLRFALAHEVGHSFFFDRRLSPHQRMSAWSPEEERFCNVFASRLLVPESAVTRLEWSQGALIELRERLDVSLQVAALAFAPHHSGHAVILLRMKPHPTKGTALRVAWSAGDPFIPVGARLNSVVAQQAWATGTSQGTEDLNLGHLRGRFRVTADRAPSSAQVLVMVRPETDLERHQLELFPRAC